MEKQKITVRSEPTPNLISSHPSGTSTAFYGVADLNGLLVAGGLYGTEATSMDGGVSWTPNIA